MLKIRHEDQVEHHPLNSHAYGGAKILSISSRKECKRRNVLNIPYVISWPHSCVLQRKDSSNDKGEDGLI